MANDFTSSKHDLTYHCHFVWHQNLESLCKIRASSLNISVGVPCPGVPCCLQMNKSVRWRKMFIPPLSVGNWGLWDQLKVTELLWGGARVDVGPRDQRYSRNHSGDALNSGDTCLGWESLAQDWLWLCFKRVLVYSVGFLLDAGQENNLPSCNYIPFRHFFIFFHIWKFIFSHWKFCTTLYVQYT